MVLASTAPPGEGSVICPTCYTVVLTPTPAQRESWLTDTEREYPWSCPKGHSGRFNAGNATWQNLE
jgi:hypothetical protein